MFFSVYTFLSVIYTQISWTKTLGSISGTVIKHDQDGDYVYEKATFTDADGKQIETVSRTSAGAVDANLQREGTVTIYYNPENSSEAEIFSWGLYLPVLMLPFGLLLIYLGWPHELLNR